MRPLLFVHAVMTALIAASLPFFALAQDSQPLPMPTEPPTVERPPVPPARSVLTNVVWIERPNAGSMSRYYPIEVLRRGERGEAILDCLVGAQGRLTCSVIRERPLERGVGAAALRVSHFYRAAPETGDGQPTAGGRVILPVRFGAPNSR